MDGQGLLLLIEFNFLIMMTRPQNITAVGNSNVLRPGHHYQKFKFHQQQETLAAHFDFTSFSAQPFFRFLAATFFTLGVFWLRYLFLKIAQFFHIFLLLRTKLQIYLSHIKIIFPCFDFFQIWNTYKAH